MYSTSSFSLNRLIDLPFLYKNNSLFERYSISPFFKVECTVTLSATLVRFVGALDVDVYRV